MTSTRSNTPSSTRTTRRSTSSPLTKPHTWRQERKKRARITNLTSSPLPPHHVSRQSRALEIQSRPSSRGKRRAVIVDDKDQEDQDVKDKRDQKYPTEQDVDSMSDYDKQSQKLHSLHEPPASLDAVDTNSEDEGEDSLLPEVAVIRVNFRRGNPNPPPGIKKDLRNIKNWPEKLFPFRIKAGYDVFIGRINGFINQIRAVKQYKRVQWWDGSQPYIRPTVSARQTSFSPIHPDDLRPQLHRALYSIMKYNARNPDKEARPFVIDVYVYLKDTAVKPTTVQQQIQSALEEANRRMKLTQGREVFTLRPGTQTLYVADTAASQFGPPANPPNPSHRSDERPAEHRLGRGETHPSNGNIAAIKLHVPGDRDHWINMEMDVEDLRRVLGLDRARAGDPTRGPVTPLAMRPGGEVFSLDGFPMR